MKINWLTAYKKKKQAKHKMDHKFNCRYINCIIGSMNFKQDVK